MNPWVKSVLWLSCLVSLAHAQQDTVHILLGRYEFSYVRGFHLDQPGQLQLNKEQLNQMAHWDVATALSYQSTAQVRSYGPGILGSVSFRGMGASRSSLIWEGIPLNYLSAGQADLSLLPSTAIQRIQMLEGGEAGRWGSGGSGGLILVETGPLNLNQPGWELQWGLQARSFGGLAGQWAVQFEGNFNWGYACLSQQWSRNNFEFRDFSQPGFPQVEQTNNKYFKNDLMAGFGQRFGRLHAAWHAWVSQAHREIPAAMGSQHQNARQNDLSVRLVQRLDWNVNQYWQALVNIGLMNDSLVYRQDGLESQFQSLAGHLRAEMRWMPLKWFNSTFGWEQSLAWATQTNYTAGIPIQHTYSPYLLSQFRPGNWLVNYSIRLPLSSMGNLNPVGSLYLGHLFNVKSISFQPGLSYKEHYRWASLNDLYWKPGGNPNLLPETGFTLEVLSEIKWKKNNRLVSWNGKGYWGKMTNYILWLPSGNLWEASQQPNSLQYGITNRFEWQYEGKKSQIQVWGQHNFQFAGDVNSKNSWAYVPTHQGQTGLVVQQKCKTIGKLGMPIQIGLNLMGQYTSERFTSEDQQQTLPEYLLFDIGIQGQIPLNNGSFFRLGIYCHNIANQSFETILRRPQPGRHFSLQLTYQIQSKTK
jgi:iron complex outermembrane receptor protein